MMYPCHMPKSRSRRHRSADADQQAEGRKKRKRLPRNRLKARQAIESRVHYRREKKALRQEMRERSDRIYQEFTARKGPETGARSPACAVQAADPVQALLHDERLRRHGQPMEAGLLLLLSLRDHWIRTPETWKRRGKSARAQYFSLVRHLLIRYPVPQFLMMVFDPSMNALEDIDAWRTFAIGVAQGQSAMRLAKANLATPLTRKMVHRLLTLRGDYTPRSAIRRVQVETWCKHDPIRTAAIHHAIMKSCIGDGMGRPRILLTERKEAFWAPIIQRFCSWDDLNIKDIGPLFDYISRRPEDWEITGRTCRSLLRDMEEWHKRLSHSPPATPVKGPFRSSGFKPHYWEKKTKQSHITYRIGEILTVRDLYREGSVLSHCVASYAEKVKTGTISIWSLRRYTTVKHIPDGPPPDPHVIEWLKFEHWTDRVLTIEVNNDMKRIIQVRGKYNRDPTREEKNRVMQWAVKNGLSWQA